MQPLVEEMIGPHGPSKSSPGPVQQPSSVLEGLRNEVRSRWPEWAAISCFAALVAFAIPWHEPWSDEAQAWQLARSLSLPALFQTYIRYEGTPGLWHFLLWVLIRARVSYSGLHWICGVIAVAAASLLVVKSPFPRYLKLALPFTFFLLFQYAVVARSYVLVPLLLFLVALQWKRSPAAIALLLGLLANVALHASVISAGLAIVYFLEKVRSGGVKDPGRRRQLLFFSIILVCFYAFALWTAWPPGDLPTSSFRGPSRPLFILALGSLSMGVCQPLILALPFWIAVALCLRARHSLLYLLPVLFFAAFSGAVYVHFFHSGILAPLLMCIFWITWPAPGCGHSRREAFGRAALVFMAGVQILWSAYALGYDHFRAYSPAPATAEFLRPFVRDGDTIAVTHLGKIENQDYEDVGILPYFDHNILANQQDPFWRWGPQNKTEVRFDALLPSRPQIVLVEALPEPGQPVNLNDAKADLLFKSGYRFTNQFCGRIPARLDFFGGPTCFLIFQSTGSPQEPPANKASQASAPN